MSYSLIIRQKTGLLRQRPSFAALKKYFGAMFQIGGVTEDFAFTAQLGQPSADGESHYMVYGATAQLGRGFYLFIDKSGVCELSSPIPTTTHDLEDLFIFAGMLAKILDVKVLEDNAGRLIPRAGLTMVFAEVKRRNFEALASLALTQDEPVISAVRLPLYIPKALCGRITSVPPENGEVYFSAYLAEKQHLDYHYMRPRFHKAQSGVAVGVYTLSEAVPSIVPKAPYIPAGPRPLGGVDIDEWVVELAPQHAPVLGSVPYGVFLAGLQLREPVEFDEKHFAIRGQSLRWMKELLAER